MKRVVSWSGARRTVARYLRAVAGVLGARLAVLGAQVAYRRRELGVIALVSTSILGGYAIDTWRKRDPTTWERLEAEPPRLVAASRASAPSTGARSAPARSGGCEQPARGPGRLLAEPSLPAPTPEVPLDLNQATAEDLMRLPGVGPRLAERILARRAALGGRFRSIEELASVPGFGRHRADLVGAVVTTGGPSTSQAPEEPRLPSESGSLTEPPEPPESPEPPEPPTVSSSDAPDEPP